MAPSTHGSGRARVRPRPALGSARRTGSGQPGSVPALPLPTTGYAIRGPSGRVVDAVGRQIVAGRFAPGEALPAEAELTAEHRVSRTPVREAMRVPAAKGTLEFRRKPGTRVRPREQWNVFDLDTLRWHHVHGLGEGLLVDLVETCQLPEPAAARLATARATMDDLGRMERAIVAMADQGQGLEGYAAAEFHLAVHAASHDLLFRQFGTVVADLLHLMFNLRQVVTTPDDVLSVDVARHVAVFDAINRGNGEAAAEVMLTIVLDGKRALGQAFAGTHRSERTFA